MAVGNPQLIKGNIAACNADVVIVSASRHILTIRGGAQKSVCDAASRWEIKKELRDRYGYNESTVLPAGEITVVGGYNLCDHILLVQAPRAHESADVDGDLERTYLKAFAKALDLMAGSSGVIRIACSLMSSGDGGQVERPRVCRIALNAAKEFVGSSNRDVEISVYSLDPVKGMGELSYVRDAKEESSRASETDLAQFVQQLRNRVEKRGGSYSVARMAKDLGVDRATLSRIENGKTKKPRLDVVCKLASFCDELPEIKTLFRLCDKTIIGDDEAWTRVLWENNRVKRIANAVAIVEQHGGERR